MAVRTAKKAVAKKAVAKKAASSNKTKAQIEQELLNAKKELQELKEGIVEAAREAKEEHGWCRDGINAALDKVGLSLNTEQTVEITLKATLSLDQDDMSSIEYDVTNVLGNYHAFDLLSKIEESLENNDIEVMDTGNNLEVTARVVR